MKKPQMLQKGDKIAVVSLSSGMMGDALFIHKYEIAKSRLENVFGLKVVPIPHALKGSEFIYENPKARAKDLMDAFQDDSIKGIFCAIGGEDSIRILPYIDYDVIRDNPKVFIGYSDSTISHLIMNKAGLISFYGVTVVVEFGEYVKMFDYTREQVEKILFADCKGYEIKPSKYWSKDFVSWDPENVDIGKELLIDEKGYEVLQGSGVIRGSLLGGCVDVFSMCVGTEIWPSPKEWKDKILLLETSEEKMPPKDLKYALRGLAAQGVLGKVRAIVVGKPQEEVYYEEYKEVYKKVLKEYCLEELPIIYNVNIGHAYPTGILPLGSDIEIDFDSKKILLVESPCEQIS